MTAPPDLQRYLQRRRLQSYEQSMARLSYAYGVDVRRSRWLASSSMGNSLVRAVDRRWSSLTSELMTTDVLRDPGLELSVGLLRRIGRVRHLLRAPQPVLRVLGSLAADGDRWPLLTPLGPTHGEIHWLVLDAEKLADIPDPHLDFMIGAALGHLQCDHGVFFAAHLLMARNEPFPARLVRRLLAPWSRVMVFSADRAGMLAAGTLETALAAMRQQAEHDARISWLPHWPGPAVRERALVEFDRSTVMARIRSIRARSGTEDEISLVEPRADLPNEQTAASAEPLNATSRPSESSPPLELGIPADAWSLARCDARLTDRLGLL